jgi:hypothetical protein
MFTQRVTDPKSSISQETPSGRGTLTNVSLMSLKSFFLRVLCFVPCQPTKKLVLAKLGKGLGKGLVKGGD